MRYAYDILMQVQFKHNYFSDNVFNGLAVTIDSATQKMLNNLELLYKPFKGGFYILYDKKIEIAAPRTRADILKENEVFDFTLELKDPLFYNYTAGLPAQIDKSIYYFRNSLNTTPGVINPLHHDEFVSEKDVVNLSDNRHHYFKKPFAKLSILLHPELETQYGVSFNVRQTTWRYILMSDYLRGMNDLAIIDKDNNVFGERFEIELPDAKKVFGFASANKLSLSQSQPTIYALVENYKKDEETHKYVINALPFPDVSSISRISVNDTNPINYSDIFIH
jgi:hypothetical protein